MLCYQRGWIVVAGVLGFEYIYSYIPRDPPDVTFLQKYS